mmetsp:Transcript_58457/g.187748  ORF Transcript_58457/g.187748 Transcript_58457/m.187748 type:complete len:250 (-) Transcript_58457:15-764(-)
MACQSTGIHGPAYTTASGSGPSGCSSAAAGPGGASASPAATRWCCPSGCCSAAAGPLAATRWCCRQQGHCSSVRGLCSHHSMMHSEWKLWPHWSLRLSCSGSRTSRHTVQTSALPLGAPRCSSGKLRSMASLAMAFLAASARGYVVRNWLATQLSGLRPTHQFSDTTSAKPAVSTAPAQSGTTRPPSSRPSPSGPPPTKSLLSGSVSAAAASSGRASTAGSQARRATGAMAPGPGSSEAGAGGGGRWRP